MSHARSKLQSSWFPKANLKTLQERAKLLKQIRSFFDESGAIEVDTPLLCQSTVTSVFLESFSLDAGIRYLQTSPEYAMKRILAAYNIPIYYLGKAFRQGEFGRKHNPEFTMLEWYRPQWDHRQLIEEIDQLFQKIFNWSALNITTYQAVFEEYLHVNPFTATNTQLKQVALENNWVDASFENDTNGWLDLLMTHGIEARLGVDAPVAIVDYPATQCALAVSKQDENSGYWVAERFEVYYQGIELANGYHELTCPIEQQKRFEADNRERRRRDLPELPLDFLLLDALKAGMGTCAGVAVGFDRLLMLKLGVNTISEVLAFDWENA